MLGDQLPTKYARDTLSSGGCQISTLAILRQEAAQ